MNASGSRRQASAFHCPACAESSIPLGLILSLLSITPPSLAKLLLNLPTDPLRPARKLEAVRRQLVDAAFPSVIRMPAAQIILSGRPYFGCMSRLHSPFSSYTAPRANAVAAGDMPIRLRREYGFIFADNLAQITTHVLWSHGLDFSLNNVQDSFSTRKSSSSGSVK